MIDLHLYMLMQNLKLPFKLFLLPSLLVNNILESVPLQIYMAVNTLKKNQQNRSLVPPPQTTTRQSYNARIVKGFKCVMTILSLPPDLAS